MGGWRQERASCVKSACVYIRCGDLLGNKRAATFYRMFACFNNNSIIQRNEGELKTFAQYSIKQLNSADLLCVLLIL